MAFDNAEIAKQLIRKRDVVDYIMQRIADNTFDQAISDFGEYLWQRPPVDLAPITTAQWLPVDESAEGYKCSDCGTLCARQSCYCPECGATMYFYKERDTVAEGDKLPV